MSEVIVSADRLSKTYKVYEKPIHRLAEALTRRPRHREFHALRGVTFDLPVGQGLAIVGQNGAGKSTLLKILAGVTTPSSGTAYVGGGVASILELGSGFHPEFTGQQNIRLNAALLGLSEQEVEARIPEIIAFSELGEFVDQPVKVYSTGMRMRLGFAIAIQVEPQVLIIDEALSVGDGYFQKKCFDRLQQYVAGGGTLLFCSHAMFYVSAFCQRALWLRDGEVEALGPVDEVVRRYENFLLKKCSEEQESHARERQPALERERGNPARIVSARTNGETRPNEPSLFRYRSPWRLELEWESDQEERAFHLGVGIDRVDGVQVASFSTLREGRQPVSGARSYRASLELPELPFLKGEFSVYVFLLDVSGLHPYDVKLLDHAFAIESESYEVGLFKVPHLWQVEAGTGGEAQAEPRSADSSAVVKVRPLTLR